MYPLDAYLSSSRNHCGLSRAFTAGASRCIEPDGVGASAVSDFLSQQGPAPICHKVQGCLVRERPTFIIDNTNRL